jgi:uncharacterized Zn finger protein (UPF0148 family)
MSDENVTKNMGKLLREGAALLNLACPQCNTPLLRLKDGTLYCAKCNQQVVEQKAARASASQEEGNVFNVLAARTLAILESLIESLPERPHPEEIRVFAGVARDLVEVLQGIQKLQG